MPKSTINHLERDEVMDLLAYVLADHNVDKPAASE